MLFMFWIDYPRREPPWRCKDQLEAIFQLAFGQWEQRMGSSISQSEKAGGRQTGEHAEMIKIRISKIICQFYFLTLVQVFQNTGL